MAEALLANRAHNADVASEKERHSMPILLIILAVILPPLAVFLKRGAGVDLVIAIVLWLLGWIPGTLYALYVVLTDRGAAV